MKLCTKLRIQASHVDSDGTLVVDDAVVIDWGPVPDDHDFGPDPDDPFLFHVEGSTS